MPRPNRHRRLLLFLALYLAFSLLAGIFLADGTMHPSRRPLTPEDQSTMQTIAQNVDADVEDVTITTPDATTLRAWIIRPHHTNGNAVILLHGLADNRAGMTGYAQLLLTHGFTVLLPDARAHGQSGGQLATFGLLERNDIRQWFDLLAAHSHPNCIYGLGESMGAAELLQSLEAKPKEVEPHFCAVAAESSFSSFREIAYDRMGQPFHLGSLFGRTLLRPVVEFAFLYVRLKYHLDMQQVSPENAVATTKVPIFLIHGQIDSNIPLRHAQEIQAHNKKAILWEVPNADHCGAISTSPKEFEHRLLEWFSTAHVETAASAVPPKRSKAEAFPNPWPLPFCISCALPVHNQSLRSSKSFRSRNPANRTPALHAPYSHISVTFLIRADLGKSVPNIFLNCTKNTELTTSPLPRTF